MVNTMQNERTTRLLALQAECERLDSAFDDAVRAAGFTDRWALFRLGESLNWPPAIEDVWLARGEAYDAFFIFRDGEGGFLGGR